MERFDQPSTSATINHQPSKSSIDCGLDKWRVLQVSVTVGGQTTTQIVETTMAVAAGHVAATAIMATTIM